MYKIRINVTKEIINRAKYCGAAGGRHISPTTGCPVALAVRDLFPDARISDSIRFKEGSLVTAPLPSKAIDFIMMFDTSSIPQREELAPISFEIEIPDSIIEEISIDEIKEVLRNSSTMELVA